MNNEKTGRKGPAPESAKTTTTSLPGGSVVERCRFTDAPCKCGADEAALADCQEAYVSEVAASIRRRREAAYRLPPLADGRRDPLDVRATDGRAI